MTSRKVVWEYAEAGKLALSNDGNLYIVPASGAKIIAIDLR